MRRAQSCRGSSETEAIQFESPQFKDILAKIYFPDGLPSFIGFTSDEDGRLFVMTYETGTKPGEFIFDVFDPQGVFILRKSIRVYQNFMGMFIKARNGRLYAVREKENGYKEFVVSRLVWK